MPKKFKLIHLLKCLVEEINNNVGHILIIFFSFRALYIISVVYLLEGEPGGPGLPLIIFLIFVLQNVTKLVLRVAFAAISICPGNKHGQFMGCHLTAHFWFLLWFWTEKSLLCYYKHMVLLVLLECYQTNRLDRIQKYTGIVFTFPTRRGLWGTLGWSPSVV